MAEWRSEGKMIDVRDMSERHIRNTIRFLTAWVEIFNDELKRRKRPVVNAEKRQRVKKRKRKNAELRSRFEGLDL